MTGLDVSKEEIMEAAVLVTDGDLNIVADGPNLVLQVTPSVLDNMGDWCKQHHGQVNRLQYLLSTDCHITVYVVQLLTPCRKLISSINMQVNLFTCIFMHFAFIC